MSDGGDEGDEDRGIEKRAEELLARGVVGGLEVDERRRGDWRRRAPRGPGGRRREEGDEKHDEGHAD